MKKTTKKIIKYTSLFSVCVLLLTSATMFGLYKKEVKERDELAKIYRHEFWNDKKDVYTFEGVGAYLFERDIDRQTEPTGSEKEGGHKQGLSKYSIYFNYTKRDYEINCYGFDPTNIKDTTFIINSKEEFINLLLKNQPDHWNSKDINSQFGEFLNQIDFSSKSLILLNNYVQFAHPNSHKRRAAYNIKEFNLDKETNHLSIKWEFRDNNRKWIFNCDQDELLNLPAIGWGDWFKSIFLVVDKLVNMSHNSLNIEMKYSIDK